MTSHYTELLQAIQDHQRTDIEQEMFQRYHGSPRYCYGVRVPDKRKIAKKFLREHALSLKEFVDLLSLLYKGKSYDERTLAGYLLELSPWRRQVTPTQLAQWLDQLEGWAEVDTTCQSSFSAEEIVAQWPDWKKLLIQLNGSSNINQRRASLVLLVRATRESKDERLADLALQLIENLENERDILITKAISWLLRSMTTHHPDTVAQYLSEHQETLPKIALRETRIKLETGKKNHGRKK